MQSIESCRGEVAYLLLWLGDACLGRLADVGPRQDGDADLDWRTACVGVKVGNEHEVYCRAVVDGFHAAAGVEVAHNLACICGVWDGELRGYRESGGRAANDGLVGGEERR